MGKGQERRKNEEQSETWCSLCIGVSRVSLGSLRPKRGGRPLEFVGLQDHMNPEGNLSSLFVLYKSWISDGELHWRC